MGSRSTLSSVFVKNSDLNEPSPGLALRLQYEVRDQAIPVTIIPIVIRTQQTSSFKSHQLCLYRHLVSPSLHHGFALSCSVETEHTLRIEPFALKA